MPLPPLTRVGFLLQGNAIKEHLLVRHFFQRSVEFEKAEALFFEIHEEMHVPFFITYSEAIDAETTQIHILQKDELSNPRTLRQNSILLSEEQLRKYAAAHCPLLYNSFHVYYQGRNLGTIKDWIYQKKQTTLMVISGAKERTLPFHESYIHAVDTQKKKLTMAWPENLLSILDNA